MNKLQKTISVFLLTAVLLLLVFLPKITVELMDRPGYIDFFKPKQEPFGGVITCWHVVGFRPYLGSLGTWLKKYASKLEKKHYGVYLNVEVIELSEAEARLAEGRMPDLISFPAGLLPASALTALDGDFAVDTEPGMAAGSLRAVPYAASCRLILYDPAKKTPEELAGSPETAAANTFDAFKKGKADCCITDVRGAGDVFRLLSAGKADYFDVLPFEERTDLVQFIGISADIRAEKLSYCCEFIALITAEQAQKELTELGLLPMNTAVEARFEQSFLADAYALIRHAEAAGKKPFRNAFERRETDGK